MLIRSIVAVSVLSLVIAGCGIGPDSMDGEPVEMAVEAASSEQALVSCSTRCGDGTVLSCSGTTCSALDGNTGYVTCDGVTKSCVSCTYNGINYPEGAYLRIGYCKDKYTNGICVDAGPRTGWSCISGASCASRCVNGAWQ